MNQSIRGVFLAMLTAAEVLGCGSNQSSSTNSAAQRDQSSPETQSQVPAGTQSKKKFQPLQLADNAEDSLSQPTSRPKISDEKRAQAIVDALQPFQVLLGQWHWVTRKAFGDFSKTDDDLLWIWDFQTDASRPAIKGTSESNPYFQKIWLTWLADDEKFQVTGKTPEGGTRILQGTWTAKGEPREESDGKRSQRSYEMQLTQVSPDTGDQWRMTLRQVDNNQYQMDLMRRPASGKQFGPLDSVRQQRLGTSFAVADSDNPGPKCIISGGLGTMSVQYKGKSYPVCCSGCAAAFNDDPERWLAKLAEKEKSKKEDK